MPTRPAVTCLLALALALALALPACGDDENGSGSDPDPGAPTATTIPGGGDASIPDLPDNDDPAQVQCTGRPRGIFDATATVGDPLAAAEAEAEAVGCTVREVIRDGEGLAVTEDYRPDRVNVETDGGEVTRIVGIG